MGKGPDTAEEVDGSFEVLRVAVSTSTSFDGHDFAVQSFRHSVGHTMTAVGHDVIEMRFQRVGHLADRGQSHVCRPEEPALEVTARPALGR